MSLPSNFHRSTFSCSWPSQSGHPKTPSQQNLKQLWAQWANCQRLVVSEQCQGCVTLFQSCLLFQSCPKAVWHCLRAVSRLCHIFSEQCQCCVNIVSELLIFSELSQGCVTLFQSYLKAVSHLNAGHFSEATTSTGRTVTHCSPSCMQRQTVELRRRVPACCRSIDCTKQISSLQKAYSGQDGLI